ncbi:hypothetical protein AMECASPLE_028690 [Ameca splendens]|uniref:Uncharacterized protein n=1 Tax=Ameca splendens TaxID=208324 RepID=A0ABV0YTF6_9TELE
MAFSFGGPAPNTVAALTAPAFGAATTTAAPATGFSFGASNTGKKNILFKACNMCIVSLDHPPYRHMEDVNNTERLQALALSFISSMLLSLSSLPACFGCRIWGAWSWKHNSWWV